MGPCQILRKYSANAYEVDLLEDIDISPIFNVSDLYKHYDGDASTTTHLPTEVDH